MNATRLSLHTEQIWTADGGKVLLRRAIFECCKDRVGLEPWPSCENKQKTQKKDE